MITDQSSDDPQPPKKHLDIFQLKIAVLFFIAVFGLAPYAFANLIADPTFANSTTISPTTTYTQDGKWDFLQLSPTGGVITFPQTMQFDPKTKGDIFAAPLDVNGLQIQLTNGQMYSYSVTVLGPGDRDIFLYSGNTQQLSFAGGGGAGATYSGVFTASVDGVLSFVVPSADPKMGITNVSVDIFTPEPRSVIFCALLLGGIAHAERGRLRKILARVSTN